METESVDTPTKEDSTKRRHGAGQSVSCRHSLALGKDNSNSSRAQANQLGTPHTRLASLIKSTQTLSTNTQTLSTNTSVHTWCIIRPRCQIPKPPMTDTGARPIAGTETPSNKASTVWSLACAVANADLNNAPLVVGEFDTSKLTPIMQQAEVSQRGIN